LYCEQALSRSAKQNCGGDWLSADEYAVSGRDLCNNLAMPGSSFLTGLMASEIERYWLGERKMKWYNGQ